MVILAGDFGQLMPVVRDEDKLIYQKALGKDMGNGCCFHSHYWPEYKFIPVVLRQQMRQADSDFCNALNMESQKKAERESISSFRPFFTERYQT